MNNYCTFYIVRHGQTDWNVARILQGQQNSHLTSLGKKQLEKTRQQLENVPFDALFSSDLDRTLKSAEILRGKRNLQILTSPLLRERTYGVLEGITLDEFRKVEEYLDSLDDKERFVDTYKNQIESDKAMMDRLVKFLRKIEKEYEGKTVAIVTHGAVIQTFLIMIGFGSYVTLPERLITNGSYIKVHASGDTYQVEEVWGILDE